MGFMANLQKVNDQSKIGEQKYIMDIIEYIRSCYI